MILSTGGVFINNSMRELVDFFDGRISCLCYRTYLVRTTLIVCTLYMVLEQLYATGRQELTMAPVKNGGGTENRA